MDFLRFLFSSSVCFCPATLEENVFLAYRPALCSIVFSALTESNGALQITATSVLTLLARQSGETAGRRADSIGNSAMLHTHTHVTDVLHLPGLLLDSDIELAVDHLTRLLLTEEDGRVRSAHVEHPSLVRSLSDSSCSLYCKHPNRRDVI